MVEFQTKLQMQIACPTNETKLWSKSVCKQHQNPCFGPSAVYQDVGMHAEIAAQHLCYHDWPVKNAIVHLLIRLKKEKEMHFCYLVESIGAQNKDIGATSQMLLTEVTLRLSRRLQMQGVTVLQNAISSFTLLLSTLLSTPTDLPALTILL